MKTFPQRRTANAPRAQTWCPKLRTRHSPGYGGRSPQTPGNSNHAAFTHHVDIVGQAYEFLEFGRRDDDNAVPFDRYAPEQRVDLGFGVHIDALSWFLDQQHTSIPLERPGNCDFLLIAAA